MQKASMLLSKNSYKNFVCNNIYIRQKGHACCVSLLFILAFLFCLIHIPKRIFNALNYDLIE